MIHGKYLIKKNEIFLNTLKLAVDEIKGVKKKVGQQNNNK